MLQRCIGIAKNMGMAVVAFSMFMASQDLYAQSPVKHYQVSQASQQMTMASSSSQVLTFDHDVPYLVVGNQDVLKASPISPNKILVTASKPGISTISVKDPQENSTTIEVHVIADVRELQRTLDKNFKKSAVRAEAIKGSVLLTGHVARSEQVNRIVEVAEQFFPNVINGMTVLGSQKVMLKVKIVEVSRTKLRKLGIDWSVITDSFNLASNVSGLLGGGTISSNILSNGDQFNLLIDTLEQNNLAKILAEPVVTSMSGRPAAFLSGGQVPISVNSGLGVQSVEFRPFGTKVDFVPFVLGEGRIRLEVRPEISEIAGDLRDPVTGTPGFRTRSVDTGVEMKVGQTLALAGLIQNRVDSVQRGMPVLKDLPLVGAAFRRTEETFNEVELLILITPYFINEVDGTTLPAGPGRNTVSPNDRDFYIKGYTEVPTCNKPFELGPIHGGITNPGTIHNMNQTRVQPESNLQQADSPTQSQIAPAKQVGYDRYPVQRPTQRVDNGTFQLPSASAQPEQATGRNFDYFPRPNN